MTNIAHLLPYCHNPLWGAELIGEVDDVLARRRQFRLRCATSARRYTDPALRNKILASYREALAELQRCLGSYRELISYHQPLIKRAADPPRQRAQTEGTDAEARWRVVSGRSCGPPPRPRIATPRGETRGGANSGLNPTKTHPDLIQKFKKCQPEFSGTSFCARSGEQKLPPEKSAGINFTRRINGLRFQLEEALGRLLATDEGEK